MTRNFRIFLFYIFILTQAMSNAETYFQTNQLHFDSGKTGFIPSTPNLASSPTKIVGGLALENGIIISGQLRTLIDYVTPFVGAIMPLSVTNNAKIPGGWLPCDGREIAISTYPTLYKAIGTKWGTASNPTLLFKIPNLSDYFIQGTSSTRAVSSSQNSAIANHTHTITGTTETVSASHSHSIAGPPHAVIYNTIEGPDDGRYPGWTVEPITNTGISDDTHTHTLNIASAGGSEMLPKRIYLIYCIKATPF